MGLINGAADGDDGGCNYGRSTRWAIGLFVVMLSVVAALLALSYGERLDRHQEIMTSHRQKMEEMRNQRVQADKELSQQTQEIRAQMHNNKEFLGRLDERLKSIDDKLESLVQLSRRQWGGGAFKSYDRKEQNR